MHEAFGQVWVLNQAEYEEAVAMFRCHATFTPCLENLDKCHTNTKRVRTWPFVGPGPLVLDLPYSTNTYVVRVERVTPADQDKIIALGIALQAVAINNT